MLSQHFWNNNDQQFDERLAELFEQKSFQSFHIVSQDCLRSTQDQMLIQILLICFYFAYKILLNFVT